MILAALIVVPSLFLGHRIWEGTRTELLLAAHPFTPAELSQAEAAFAAAKLTTYSLDGSCIRVARQQRSDYVRALVDRKALPRTMDATASDHGGGGNPLETPSQREDRLRTARDQELASYLRFFPEIEDASVRLDEAVLGSYRSERKIRALVWVKPKPGHLLLPERLQAIRESVAASRVGLSPDDVTIVDVLRGVTFNPSQAPTPAQRAQQVAYCKASYEADWTQKLHKSLEYIAGVSVHIQVALTTDTHLPRRIAVSVTIPQSHYLERWRASHPREVPNQTAGQELQVIEAEEQRTAERHVIQVLAWNQESGVETDVDVVTGAAFTARNAPRRSWDQPNALVASIVVVMLVVAAFALVGFPRSESHPAVVRRTTASPVATKATNRPTSSAPADHAPVAEATSLEPQPATAAEGGSGVASAELVALVRENPQAAAAILRSWVNPAA